MDLGYQMWLKKQEIHWYSTYIRVKLLQKKIETQWQFSIIYIALNLSGKKNYIKNP